MIWLHCFSLLFLFLFAFLFDFHLGAVVYMKWRLTNALYVCMYVCNASSLPGSLEIPRSAGISLERST